MLHARLPGDPGFCWVTLDIERVETQKVLKYIAAVSTADVSISSLFSNTPAPGNTVTPRAV